MLSESDIKSIYQVGKKLDDTCYMDSYKRIKQAAPHVGGRTLPAWDPYLRFCRIWGSLIRNDGAWARFPAEYRGFGAPGALALAGWTQLIRGPKIWNGDLLPGAVLQAWRSPQFYRDVRAGTKPDWLLGHSFVFIGYERSGGRITGMRVADNGFHGNNIIKPRQWPVLVGANTVGDSAP